MRKFHIYNGNFSYLVKQELMKRDGWEENQEQNNPFHQCQFIWKPTNLTISVIYLVHYSIEQGYTKLDNIQKTQNKEFVQVFNHFENIRGICTKTGLIRSLRKYYSESPEAKSIKYGVFDSTPTSFVITAGVEDYEYGLFVQRYRDIAKQTFAREAIPSKHCQNNIWLVKPANLNQGRGIEVFKSLKEILSFLGSKSQNTFWVVQKYIEKPLLYRGRKFDIRIWAIFTGSNEVFVYKRAYVRTSSDSYDLNNQNNYVHLTNQCLQVHGDGYGKHEDGNTLALHDLDAYFKEIYPDYNIKVDSHVKPRMVDLILDTFHCYQKQLNPNRRKNVFELFGYDFLIDEDMRTWLIEVNTNPHLGTQNKYMEKLVPEMLTDMISIVVDPILPPKTPFYRDRPNDFELVYCENGSRWSDKPINKRSTFSKEVYPIKELAPPDYIKRVIVPEPIKPEKATVILKKAILLTPIMSKQSSAAILPNSNLSTINSPSPMTMPIINPNNTLPNISVHGSHATITETQTEGDQHQSLVTETGYGVTPKRVLSNSPNKIITVNRHRITKMAEPIESDRLKKNKLPSIKPNNDQRDHIPEEKVMQLYVKNQIRANSSEEKQPAIDIAGTKNSIETIYKNLHLALIYKSSSNPSNIGQHLSRILSCLKNWELFSDKNVKLACKTLGLIAQSGANFLLTEVSTINELSDLLTANDIKIEIKFSVVEALLHLAKEMALKKKLMCNKLVHDLIDIVVTSCSMRTFQDYPKGLRIAGLRCLETLGGIFNRKVYQISESREMDKLRSFFIAQGGVFALWLIGTRSHDEDLREFSVKSFLCNLEIQDWEKQLQILKLLKITNYDEKPKEKEIKEAETIESKERLEEDKEDEKQPEVLKTQIMFYKSGDFTLADKPIQIKSDKPKDVDKIIQFPPQILRMFPIDKITDEFSDFVKNLQESFKKKEMEERERRQMLVEERIKRVIRNTYEPYMDPNKKPPKRLDQGKGTPLPWVKKETELLENISIRPLDTQEKYEPNLAATMKIQLTDFDRITTEEGDKKALDSIRYMRGSKTPDISEFKSAPVERTTNQTKSPIRLNPEKRAMINKHQHRNLYQIVHGNDDGKIFDTKIMKEPPSPTLNLSKDTEMRLLEHKKFKGVQGEASRYSSLLDDRKKKDGHLRISEIMEDYVPKLTDADSYSGDENKNIGSKGSKKFPKGISRLEKNLYMQVNGEEIAKVKNNVVALISPKQKKKKLKKLV